MPRLLLCPALLTLVLLSACRPQPIIIHSGESQSQPGAKGEALASPANTLTVQGLATLEVAPDRLDLRIELRERDPRPDLAVAAIRKRQAALEAAIGNAGLAEVERTIGRLGLSEHFEEAKDKRVKVGYQASLTLTVSLHDFDKVGVFMQLASENGAESMSTQFRSTRLSELKTQVRADAVAAARSKAEQLANLSGIELGAIVALSEGDHREAYWGQSSVANSYTPAAVGAALRQGDSQELSIQVSITYSLAPS